MHGIIVIDKPAGITSHDVVARVRRLLRTKKVGHTGTLDPFATGVMVILVGQATRLAQFLDKDEKEYEAVIQFGSETDTGDVTGTRTADRELPIEELEARVAEIDWNTVFEKFRGDQMQTPPMYSAKKIDGKKLYELAREGKEVERKAVPVKIHKLELSNAISTPRSAIRITVACSAGTYIRTLAEEIGREAGLGAHLGELRRTAAGKFDISMAATLDELAENTNPLSVLIPMADAVSHLQKVRLGDERIARTKNGLSSRIDESDFADGETLQILNSEGDLIAIGQFDQAENSVQPKIVLG